MIDIFIVKFNLHSLPRLTGELAMRARLTHRYSRAQQALPKNNDGESARHWFGATRSPFEEPCPVEELVGGAFLSAGDT